MSAQPGQRILDELRYLCSLHGSFLFAFNALIPLYPVGRATLAITPPLGLSEKHGPDWLPSWLSNWLRKYTVSQLQVLAIIVAIGVVIVFVPLYVRLLLLALGKGSGTPAPNIDLPATPAA